MSAQTGTYKVALTPVTTTAVGGVLKLVNPEGANLIITRLILNITTPATGTPTVDGGIHAAGTSNADNLVDGLAVGVAAGVFDNVKDGGTNGKAAVLWPVGHHLVITASASAAGLVGHAHIQYARA
jgi:hypothetical protein